MSVVMAGSTILAAWAEIVWGNGAAMIVVPEKIISLPVVSATVPTSLIMTVQTSV
jgi:hypothetical protein